MNAGHFDHSQKKITFVLIRGLSRSVEHWNHFPEILQEAFPQCEIVSLELPGNGALYRQKSPLSISGFVREMRPDFLQKVNKNQPVFFIAISLGGMIANEWLRMYPQDAMGAALLVTSNGRVSPVYRRLRPSSILTGIEFLRARGPEEKELAALRRVCNRPIDRETLKYFVSVGERYPISLPNFFRQLFAAAFYCKKPEGHSHRILLLGSLGDRLVSPRCTMALALRSGNECSMHPSAGHEVPLDDPVWIVNHLVFFLKDDFHG